MRNGWGKSILAAASMCTGGAALAQETPPPPPDLPTRGQIEQNLPENQRPEPSRARIDTSKAMAHPPCALEQSDVRVNLTSLSLEKPDGSALAPELQSLLAGVDADLHGEQPIAVVCQVRDRINARLGEAGYVALAQIPGQQISNGVLHVQVVTARIVEVRIVGDPGPFRSLLEERVAQIRALEPLNRHDAERILLLTGDTPGLDVQLALSAANGTPGDVIGTLTVETRRFALLANVQNYGSHELGRWIGSVRGEAYGLTGMADRTYLAFSNAFDWKEVRVLQAGHDFTLADNGLRMGLRGSLAWSRPDIENLDLRSRSTIAGLDLTMPIRRTVRQTISATTGFEFLDQKSDIHASDTTLPFTSDKLRVLYARIDYDLSFLDGNSELVRAAGSLELRKGLDIFGATKEGLISGQAAPSRLFGNPTATVVKGNLDLAIKPHPMFELDLGGFGQWANDPLLNLEEFSVGNYTRGRGYDPGANGGDRAYGFTIEPRIKLPIANFSVQASGFYDWVHLENLDPGTNEPKRTLRSVGGGLRFILPQRLVIDLTYAHPLDKVLSTDAKKPADRLLISLTAKLF
ncbi:Hemolysin activation/secretion protein [Novosphingobium sp. CF614]|uniref:ShlB/FhaC/HecB family hemolysin secretion/activation protein n=1 Tax=Novosphingobium sp. CF614 TaxID=1884364 RepID=UPI0008E2C07A|nr:ShlB/FhaC/HecB family hemolysin secretion/activation protein [Novosphingobium sp. CF614]SFG14817.1 Hemolysin activation/secretion protein [Novosphingobium sp. CF614]